MSLALKSALCAKLALIEYVPAARACGSKLAVTAPVLGAPEIGVPTTLLLEFLIVKMTVPSLTGAEEVKETLTTVALRFTAVDPYVAVAEAAEVEVFARVMVSVAGVPLNS